MSESIAIAVPTKENTFYERYFRLYDKRGPKEVIIAKFGPFCAAFGTDTEGPDIRAIADLLNLMVYQKEKEEPVSNSNPYMVGIPKICEADCIRTLHSNGYTVIILVDAEKYSDNAAFFDRVTRFHQSIKDGNTDEFEKFMGDPDALDLIHHYWGYNTALTYAVACSRTNFVKRLYDVGGIHMCPETNYVKRELAVYDYANAQPGPGGLKSKYVDIDEGYAVKPLCVGYNKEDTDIAAVIQKQAITICHLYCHPYVMDSMTPTYTTFHTPQLITCLNYACMTGNLEMVWVLLQNGVGQYPTQYHLGRDGVRVYPLEHASGYPEICKLLISKGEPVAVQGQFIMKGRIDSSEIAKGLSHRNTLWSRNTVVDQERDTPYTKTHERLVDRTLLTITYSAPKPKYTIECEDVKFEMISSHLREDQLERIKKYMVDRRLHKAASYKYVSYNGVKYKVSFDDRWGHYYANIHMPNNYMFVCNDDNTLYLQHDHCGDEGVTIRFDCRGKDDFRVENPYGVIVWTYEMVEDRCRRIIDEMVGQVRKFEKRLLANRSEDLSVDEIEGLLKEVARPLES